jgi:hypothetical protein
MPDTLLDRRAALLEEQAELRRQRGAAVLDGRDFSGAKRLAAIDAELAALDDAEREDHRRGAEAHATAEAARRQAIAQRIADRAEARLAALDKAEAAARAMVAALAEALDLSAGIHADATRLGEPPLPLARSEIENRCSRLLALALRPVARAHSFGVLTWNSIPHADDSWRAIEHAATNPTISVLVQGVPT